MFGLPPLLVAAAALPPAVAVLAPLAPLAPPPPAAASQPLPLALDRAPGVNFPGALRAWEERLNVTPPPPPVEYRAPWHYEGPKEDVGAEQFQGTQASGKLADATEDEQVEGEQTGEEFADARDFDDETYAPNYYGWYEDPSTATMEYGYCFIPSELRNEIDRLPKYTRDVEEYGKNNKEIRRIVDDEGSNYLAKEDGEENNESRDAKNDADDEDHGANDNVDNEQNEVIRVSDPAMITGVNEDGSNQYSDAIVSKGDYLAKEDGEENNEYHDAKSDVDDEDHDANDNTDNEQKKVICVPDPAMITGVNEDGSNQYSDAIVSKGKRRRFFSTSLFRARSPTRMFGNGGRWLFKATAKGAAKGYWHYGTKFTGWGLKQGPRVKATGGFLGGLGKAAGRGVWGSLKSRRSSFWNRGLFRKKKGWYRRY